MNGYITDITKEGLKILKKAKNVRYEYDESKDYKQKEMDDSFSLLEEYHAWSKKIYDFFISEGKNILETTYFSSEFEKVPTIEELDDNRSAIIGGYIPMFIVESIILWTEEKIKKMEEIIISEKKKVNIIKKEKTTGLPHKIPAGTNWNNVTITFLDKENIKILVKGIIHQANYKDLKMTGRGKKPGPSMAWNFLFILAQLNGEITTKDKAAINSNKKQKEILSNKLKDYFHLQDDPFYPYKNGNSYKLRMTIFLDRNCEGINLPNEEDNQSIEDETKEMFNNYQNYE